LKSCQFENNHFSNKKLSSGVTPVEDFFRKLTISLDDDEDIK
jgi:hypothetical protein